jgi:hypothetical protein
MEGYQEELRAQEAAAEGRRAVKEAAAAAAQQRAAAAANSSASFAYSVARPPPPPPPPPPGVSNDDAPPLRADPPAERNARAASKSALAAIAEASRARAAARERSRANVLARAADESAAADRSSEAVSAAIARGSVQAAAASGWGGRARVADTFLPPAKVTAPYVVTGGSGGWADSLLSRAPLPPQQAFAQPRDAEELMAQVASVPEVAPFTAATAALAFASTERMLAAERAPLPPDMAAAEPQSVSALLGIVVANSTPEELQARRNILRRRVDEASERAERAAEVAELTARPSSFSTRPGRPVQQPRVG